MPAGPGVAAHDLPDLGADAFGGLAEVERRETSIALEQAVAGVAASEREQRHALEVAVDAPEQPWRRVLLEVADGGERVVGAEMDALEHMQAEGDREL